MKRLLLREVAVRDVRAAIDFYVAEASPSAATAFLDALESAFRDLREHAVAGSQRYAFELDLPGLRSWLVNGYPYIVFYLDNADYVDVWRILHAKRDIPVHLR